jgi:TRAP-type C4-dicarboxylate transport system permease small subunit
MRKTIDNILGKTLVAIMAIMVVNVLWQVFSRYVTGNPSSFTDELARYLMIWVGLLGAAYASGHGLHVAIDVVPMQTSKKTQLLLFRMVNVLVMLFAFFALVMGGLRLVYISHILGQTSAALNLPLAFLYLALPISGLLIIFYMAHNLVFGRDTDDENQMPVVELRNQLN